MHKTWNVRSKNYGKLDIFKKEMARVNFGILGISELKWMGMGEFIQMTFTPTTLGMYPFEEMEYPS